MKFRNKFYQHVVTVWESHYISYQQLKTLLKAAKRGGQEPSIDFYTSFAQAIVANTAFAVQRHSALQYNEGQLEKQRHDGTLSKYHPVLNYLNLMILQEALTELLCFFRVNYEAINRLYIKIVRSCQTYNPQLEDYRSIIHGHCAEHRKAYNKCVEQLHRIHARVAIYQNHESTRRVDPHSLDQDNQAVAAIFHESDKLSVVQNGYCRTPLHFAAMYGMINLCTYALSKVIPTEECILLQDGAGFTPLHVSVAHGHVEITRLLLQAIDKPSTLLPDDLLHIALRLENDAMVKLLVSRLVGVKHKSSSGESCLYIATQLGRDDYVRLLLPILCSDFIDAAESAYQWTPLFIGCVEGHISTVKLLLDAGADTTRLDYRGWTAQENAAFRGHLPVAEMFSFINVAPNLSCSHQRIDPQRKTGSSFKVRPGIANVILNLGGLQERQLSKSSTLELSNTLGHGIVLNISTSECPTPIERTVPLLDDPVDDTFVFAVRNPAEVAIIFDLRRMGVERDDYSALIGTGVSFLYSQTTCLGARHGPLLREQSVPILSKDTLKLLGTITFSFLIAEPYYQLEHPSPSVRFLETLNSVQLVGHRGFGQNSREGILQLGENTIESFLAAGKQGATFAEFDVQLTKDLVPVLFHDYSLSESGTDIPIHDVTLEQFMYASSAQSPQGNPASTIGRSRNHSAHGDTQLDRPRSRSVTIAPEKGAEELRHRMKYTVDYVTKGFKPNTRGDFVQDTFATLEHALCNVPENIGFDMEIKYPRIHEALEAGFAPMSIDINIFVDTILDGIAHHGGNRNIILTSFTPEICILLAVKQKSYPVLFISNAGKRPLVDKEKRAGSLQVAVRFAKQWGLAGIVVAADSLVMCPRLIDFVKSQGLICGSYNGLNNQPANVEVQVNAGIDLIVADRVGLISQTLERLGV